MKRIILFSALFAIFYSFFTPRHIFFEGGEAVVFAISSLLCLVSGKVFKSAPVIIACVYALFVLVFALSGYEYYKSNLPGLAVMIFSIFLFHYFSCTHNYKFMKWVVFFFCSIILFLGIISIPQLLADPMLLRNYSSDMSMDLISHSYWLISYEAVHLFPCILPFAIFIFRSNLKLIYKIVTAIISLLLIYIDFVSGAATPFLLCFLSVLFAMTINVHKTVKSNLLRIVLVSAILMIVLESQMLLFILQVIEPVFENSSLGVKINEITGYLSYGQAYGDLYARQSLYLQSINLFLDHPMLGGNNLLLGQHSFMLDVLGASGIVGVIPLFALLFIEIKTVSKMLRYTKVYYFVGIMVCLLLSYFKSTLPSFAMFLLLPAIAVILDNVYYKNSLNYNETHHCC